MISFLAKLTSCDEKDLTSLTSDNDNFTELLYASGFPYLEITAERRSMAYECLLLYEVVTKRIPAMEDIRKGLGSVRVKGITLLDLLRIHPNLTVNVFPQPNCIVDCTMLKSAMDFQDPKDDGESQAYNFLERYVDDMAKRGYNL